MNSSSVSSLAVTGALLAASLFACTPDRRDADDSHPADAGDDAADAGDGGSADAGEPETRPPCATDLDCEPFGLVCQPLVGRCVCTNDGMCAGGSAPHCQRSTGRCAQDECAFDLDCDDATYCDSGECVPRKGFCEPCARSSECAGAGAACLPHPEEPGSGSFCAPPCADGCGFGRTCLATARGQLCFPEGRACDAAPACVPDQNAGCTSDAECATDQGQLCDRASGRCLAAVTWCAVDEACDATKSCVRACRVDADCTSGASAGSCIEGRCTITGCLDDEECPAGTYCAVPDGRCREECARDDGCRLGERCLADPGSLRRRCVDGCTTDSDCPLHAVCEGGRCEYVTGAGATRCQATFACGWRESCVARACLPVPQHCQSCAGGCGAGACATLYTRVACGTVTCPGGARPTCQPDASCGGQICGCPITRCVYRCTTNAQCPKGFVCTQNPVNGHFGPWCIPSVADACE